MPYHVGLEEKAKGVTASRLLEATRTLTDPGVPEEAEKIHPGDGPCPVLLPLHLDVTLRVGRSVGEQGMDI